MIKVKLLYVLPVASIIFAGHLEHVNTELFGSIPVDTVEGGKYHGMSPDISINLC